MNFEYVKEQFIRMMNDEIDYNDFFESTVSEFNEERLGLLLKEYHYKAKRLTEGLGEYENFNGDKKTEMKNIYVELLNRTYDFVYNPCVYESPNSCNRHLCHKDCDNCITKRHWLDIIDNRPNHFVDEKNRVYYMTDIHSGGFGGSTFIVELENGKRFKCGLWSNGECTDFIANQIPKGKIIREGA